LKEFSMQCRSYTLGEDAKRERCWGTVRYVFAAIACFIENTTEGVGVFAGGPSQLTTSANELPPLLTPKDCKILVSQFKVSTIHEALLLLAQKELALCRPCGIGDQGNAVADSEVLWYARAGAAIG
jgi:hypothetical protein